MKNKLISTVLLILLSFSMFGCSKNKELSNKEDTQSNNAASSGENLNEDNDEPIKIEEVSEEIEKTYPQSIEYFKAINKIKTHKNKEKAKEVLQTLADYINKTYPYDYSQAKDKAILDTVEDFGIMERLLITNYHHMFYEATNHENTIALNYYLETSDIIRNSIIITTKDFNLRNEICKSDESLKLYDFYEGMINNLENKEEIHMKDLEKLYDDYERRETNNGVVVYKLLMDKESLIVTLEKEKKIRSIRYSNMESLYSESVSINNDVIEFVIFMNVEDLSEQYKSFHKVLDV